MQFANFQIGGAEKTKNSLKYSKDHNGKCQERRLSDAKLAKQQSKRCFASFTLFSRLKSFHLIFVPI